MSRGVNKVILLGNLGRAPELKTFENGGTLANATLATSESWKDKTTGEAKEATEWHNLTFNGKLAEIAAKYLKKGSKIYVEGSLRTRSWEKDGVKRYTTEVRVSEMQMLDGKPTGDAADAPQAASNDAASAPAAAPAAAPFEDDDIPF